MDQSTNSTSAGKKIEHAILQVLENRRQGLMENAEPLAGGTISAPASNGGGDDDDGDMRKEQGGNNLRAESMQESEHARKLMKGIGNEIEMMDSFLKNVSNNSTRSRANPMKPLSAERLARYKDLGKEMVAEGLKLDDSYSVDLVTVEQQAAKEPDFIGRDAYWYDLTKEGVSKHIDGEYVIVWTRTTGTVQEGQKKFETFGIDMENKLDVFSNKSEYENDKFLTRLFNEGCLGEMVLHASGKELDMVISEGQQDVVCIAELAIIKRTVDQPLCTSFLQEVICSKLRSRESVVAFGINVVGKTRHMTDTGSFATVTLGYEFVKVFLDYIDPATKMVEILDVVAVKIPRKGDVASAFILKQKLFDMPNPAWLVEADADSDDKSDTEMLL